MKSLCRVLGIVVVALFSFGWTPGSAEAQAPKNAQIRILQVRLTPQALGLGEKNGIVKLVPPGTITFESSAKIPSALVKEGSRNWEISLEWYGQNGKFVSTINWNQNLESVTFPGYRGKVDSGAFPFAPTAQVLGFRPLNREFVVKPDLKISDKGFAIELLPVWGKKSLEETEFQIKVLSSTCNWNQALKGQSMEKMVLPWPGTVSNIREKGGISIGVSWHPSEWRWKVDMPRCS
jgi:hypothetical protein